MHISGNFKAPSKQNNVLLKQDASFQKQAINITKIYPKELVGLSKKYISHVAKLYNAFGTEHIFSRKDVTNILDITPSPASTFIKKMLEAKIIQPVEGYSKGKYQFISTQKLDVDKDTISKLS